MISPGTPQGSRRSITPRCGQYPPSTLQDFSWDFPMQSHKNSMCLFCFFPVFPIAEGVGLFPGPDGRPRLGLLGQSLGQAKALTKLGKNPQGHINYSQRNSLKHCTIDLRTPASNRPSMPPECPREWAGLPQGLPKAIVQACPT